jgi:hypothetical protein
MTRLSLRWTALRAALLLAAALPLSLVTARIRGDYALASAWLAPSVAGTSFAMTCFAMQYLRMTPGPIARWRKPSWLENPLPLHRPLQWGLLLGEVLLLGGVGCASVDMLSVPHHCSWEIPVAAGFGVWLGTYLFARGAPAAHRAPS